MIRSLVVAAAMLSSAPAVAQTYVVNTGAPPSGNVVYALTSTQRLAGYFSLASATTLTSVEGNILSGTVMDTLTIAIYGDGSVPGVVPLYGTSFLSATYTGTGVWQGASGLNWTLAAGNYWIAFGSSNTDYMQPNVPTPLSRYAYTSMTTNWMRLDGANVGVRIASQATPLPEPAGWALTIAGIGAVGAAMRRRGGVPAAA